MPLPSLADTLADCGCCSMHGDGGEPDRRRQLQARSLATPQQEARNTSAPVVCDLFSAQARAQVCVVGRERREAGGDRPRASFLPAKKGQRGPGPSRQPTTAPQDACLRLIALRSTTTRSPTTDNPSNQSYRGHEWVESQGRGTVRARKQHGMVRGCTLHQFQRSAQCCSRASCQEPSLLQGDHASLHVQTRHAHFLLPCECVCV